MSTNMVVDIWLDPPVLGCPQAISAIKSATHIIYAPAASTNQFSSIFSQKESLRLLIRQNSKNLIINLVSNHNQTHNFTPSMYINLLTKYTKNHHPVDVIICPKTIQTQFETTHPQITISHAYEHSYFLDWPESNFKNLTNKHITATLSDTFSITPTLNRLRHASP